MARIWLLGTDSLDSGGEEGAEGSVAAIHAEPEAELFELLPVLFA
jgi:hypothetical protein